MEGILVTLYDSRNNLARDVERTVRGQYGKAYRVFETVVPRAASAAEAAATGESVFAYDPDGKVATSFSRLAEVPRIVREMTGDEAVISMVDSNLQRESIFPSERALAYSMRLEAMRRQGERTDLTCVQSEHKLKGRKSRDVLAEELGASSGKVRRCIRFTHLVPGMLPAVEVSYLSRREQKTLLDAMRENACTPSHSQALKMKRFSQEGELGEALIRSIMEGEIRIWSGHIRKIQIWRTRRY